MEGAGEECPLIINGQTIADFVKENCDRSFDLSWPSGFTLLVGTLQDTILTTRDYHFWRGLPQMEGRLQIIGTVGRRQSMAWDRRIAGVAGSGRVYLYEIHEQSYVGLAAGSLKELLSAGIRRDYFNNVRDAIQQRARQMSERTTRTARKRRAESSPSSSPLPSTSSGVTSVERAVVRRLHLEGEELTDSMFVEGTMSSSLPC
ncbi:tegument protein UL26 [Aotine betaherpesvirus 1]|uniref:Tegument protein UL26 n=1 Tax=Aotine betaherpesvirus 1 TaxID=50290 RepID=G8XUA1_9BETA|nr:tegument protein UL26 [Aotine betaherpesvirus 1]AEV80732.1 tegument protein UL26 [Aotine betaherpesvirus 1]